MNACYVSGIVLGARCANLGMGAVMVTWERSSERVTLKLRSEGWLGAGQVKMDVAVQSPPNSRLSLLVWLHCLALLSSENICIHRLPHFPSSI